MDKILNEIHAKRIKELKIEPNCGRGGNNGCFNDGICNHGNFAQRFGKCLCTTKGSTGKQCNEVSFKTAPFKMR